MLSDGKRRIIATVSFNPPPMLNSNSGAIVFLGNETGVSSSFVSVIFMRGRIYSESVCSRKPSKSGSARVLIPMHTNSEARSYMSQSSIPIRVKPLHSLCRSIASKWTIKLERKPENLWALINHESHQLRVTQTEQTKFCMAS
jgi:hypothetical protein